MRSRDHSALIDRVDVSHYKIPTDFPESDGTLKWDHTSLTIVVVSAGGAQGVGYTYAGSETAALIHEVLAGAIKGEDAMSPPAVYRSMWQKIRNIGRPGVCSMGISAVDCAVWDLKARILGVPLVSLFRNSRYAAGLRAICSPSCLALF